MFLYFFDIFFAAICAALSFFFFFSGTLIISINCSSFSIAFLLFLFKRFSLKLLMTSSCCFLNSSKSRTLFAASSMLSPLNKSSSRSSYVIVSRSSSFTKNVFFGFFQVFVFLRDLFSGYFCAFFTRRILFFHFF